MATEWLIVDVTRTSSKGATSTTDTDDTTTSTTNRGARTTTRTVPTRTTTTDRGAKASANTSTTTVTEDAGGQVNFVIVIKDGLNASGANPDVCTP